MYQRDHDLLSDPGQTRQRPLSRRGAHPVLALQRLIGNRATTRLLARKDGAKTKNKGTMENSIKIGKLGPIEIKGGNLAEWVAKKVPEQLIVTSTKGKHSEKLKRLSDDGTRFDEINVHAVTGANHWLVITIKNARVAGYSLDESTNTESWKLVDFDGVHFESTSIGVPRP
jgi:hypothetical protein